MRATQEHLEFLDDLRELGGVNMYGARRPLMDEFPELDKNEARAVLKEWMRTFAEQHGLK